MAEDDDVASLRVRELPGGAVEMADGEAPPGVSDLRGAARISPRPAKARARPALSPSQFP
jgi:hypothetical protein